MDRAAGAHHPIAGAAPSEDDPAYTGWARWKPFFAYVLPTLSIFGVVVGALAGGWATPTECAALGAFATLMLAMAYRALTFDALLKALKGTAGISGMILFIILGATTFAQILSFSGASNGLVQLITGQGWSTGMIVAGMMLMLIFLGIFVDQVSMMMITLPIFMPIVQSLGIDPVWFGVMFLICMQLGLLLPPHGLLLMTMRGVAPPGRDHGAHLPRGRALRGDEPGAAGRGVLGAGDRDVAAGVAGLRTAVRMRTIALALALFAGLGAMPTLASEEIDKALADRLTDVQSVVVVQQGRTVYQYYRDGEPDALRDTQSVAKSALAVLVGVALRQGQIASLDQAVVDLAPEWRALNADPRAEKITVGHLLAMTAGFAVDDAAGTRAPRPSAQAWARPLRSTPGEAFAYDNSAVNLLTALLEKVSGKPLREYAREQLVQPLGMAEPSYSRGLHLRTADMAKLGQLFLQDGVWEGRPLLPPGFAAQATRARTPGGPPVGLPYGLSWWAPSDSTYFASGYAGQFIWVHAPLGLVVAVTSTVSPDSQQRGQASQLIRGPLFRDAQRRASAPSR